MKTLSQTETGLPRPRSVIPLRRALALGVMVILVSCSPSGIGGMTEPGDVAVKPRPTFSEDIQPVLSEYCVKCHQPKDAHGGLLLHDYRALMAGSANGPVVVPDMPEESILVGAMKWETPPSLRMPFHQEPLTPNRIRNIEKWISLGARDN